MITVPALGIVVEGKMNARLLRRLLAPQPVTEARFFAIDGRISLATVGRNILVQEGGPVLIVEDSLSLDVNHSEESRAITAAALRQFASDEDFAVFAFIPEIEIMFFETPDTLRRVFGPLVDDCMREGLLAPKRTLNDLLARDGRDLYVMHVLANLDDDSVRTLRTGTQVKSLIATIERLLKAEDPFRAGAPWHETLIPKTKLIAAR